MQNVINLFEEARKFSKKQAEKKEDVGKKNYKNNVLYFMRPAKNDNEKTPVDNVEHSKKRRFLSKEEREFLLEDMAAGVSDYVLADDYDLTEVQVVKYRHNYGKCLHEIKKRIEKELEEEERKAALSTPIKKSLEILKDRRAVQTKTGELFLDGMLCSAVKMIKEANILLKRAGEEELHYPGVRNLPDRSAPSMKL